MAQGHYELGMIGLGTMGRNLLLNMADHGHSVAGFDLDSAKSEALKREAGQRDIQAAQSLSDLVKLLRKPRAVMLLVPAGAPVDLVISDLRPLLEAGDLIVDGGNSFFLDTERRIAELEPTGITFMGVGISGGAEGARHGPSIMPGGKREAYQRLERVLTDVAARAEGEPCVTYLGPGGAGHYVKMVHNGIEYAIMQIIAEAYDFMKRGMGLDDATIGETFDGWSRGDLNGFLMEITADIFRYRDNKTGDLLLNSISDQARQKGTGQWTSQEALQLQFPAPVIDIAVGMRDLSGYKQQRVEASKLLGGPAPEECENAEHLKDSLADAVYAGALLAYAQGMSLLRVASDKHGYDLLPADIASIWRGGCIIRSRMLNDIRTALLRQPDLPSLLFDEEIADQLTKRQAGLRDVVCAAAAMGVPAPALMTSLSFFDAYRSAWLPANLIQAQRDYFGAHTYERTDEPGVFHTEWQKDLANASLPSS
ncbi:MAG: NADP-dependent phosphogluconate dehydrogenase [Armatimonadetes bacterium]|nr:NADP-dependent phosphogluconate dehydrogenase [Armatimonadota bacterium]